MISNKILSRTYYEIRIRLISPCSIGNGKIEYSNTDADIVKNGKGECFIPGTSLAGAFRNYVDKNKNEPSTFGFSDGEDGRMSSIFVSDVCFDGRTKTSIRDRICLTDEKEVDNKFDIEVIEPGAKGSIRIETIKRENDSFNPDRSIERVIVAMQKGEIRFGAVKNRGFGRVEVETVSEVVFDPNSRGEWIKYMSGDYLDEKTVSYEEWRKSKEIDSDKYTKYQIPLRLTGGISIRKYSAQPGKADYEHITSNGEPIIPGTSWNGAIRADAKQILMEFKDGDKSLSKDDVEYLIEEWFGRVKGKKEDEKESHQSRIVISESVIENAVPMTMTRNNINRFTAGTKDGALYTEISYFGGTTTLEYMILKSDDPELTALHGIMELVVKDICNGFVPVGGQVAVGRGVFEGVGETPENKKGLQVLYQTIRRRL